MCSRCFHMCSSCSDCVAERIFIFCFSQWTLQDLDLNFFFLFLWALCKCTKNEDKINTDLIIECKLFAVKMNFSWSVHVIFTISWSGFPALQSLSVAFCLWCLSMFSFVFNKCKVAVLSLIPDDWEHWRHWGHWRQVCFFSFRIFNKVNLPVWFGYYFSAKLLHCSTKKGSNLLLFGCIFPPSTGFILRVSIQNLKSSRKP